MSAPATRALRPANGIAGLAILFGFLALGEGLARLMPLPMPGSILAMLLLTAALLTGLVKLQWVEAAADALLDKMALFFVPPGVGVMLYYDLIAREWLPLLVSFVGSTFIVLGVTAHTAQGVERLWRARHPKDTPHGQ